MTNEQHALIELLGGNDIVCYLGCDWHKVFELSCRQGVAAVAFDNVQRLFAEKKLNIPTEVKLQWYACQCQIEKQNKAVNRVLYKVETVLADNGIVGVLLKGQGLAQLYVNPLHRVSGDIDIYVDSEKYAKAKEVIAAQGWLDKSNVHEDMKHLGFSVDGVAIELHYYASIIPGIRRNRYFQTMTESALKDITEGFFIDKNGETGNDKGTFVPILPDDVNTVYTFVHMFKHFIESGMSLRQVMDWSLLLQKIKGTDKKILRERLENIGLLKPWQVFGCILVSSFSFTAEEIPCYDNRYANKAKKVLELIFKDCEKGNALSNHADSLKQKTKVMNAFIRNFGRVYMLFPMETCAFSARWLMNVTTKYLHLYKR